MKSDYRKPFPNSRKVYVRGEMHAEIKVGMREIMTSKEFTHFSEGKALRSTLESDGGFLVYDTSGFYTDPEMEINLKSGLFKIRPR